MCGDGFTETVLVVLQPVGNVYVITVVHGPPTPVTTPVAIPTTAQADELLDQVPPAVASESEIVIPEHTTDGPVIGAGRGLTVTV